MTIKASDITTTFDRIKAKVSQTDWDRVTATFTAPVPALRTELGPLTDKVGKQSTVDAALMLAAQMDAAQPSQELLNAVNNVYVSLVSSRVEATSASVEAGVSLSFSLQNLQAAVTKQTGSVPSKIVAAPLLVQLLDVMIIQAVAAVPIVGPALSGVLGGVATGLAAGFTYGGNAVANLLATQAKDNPSDPITGVASNWQGAGNNAVKGVTKGVAGVIGKDSTFAKGNPGTIQGAVEGSGALGQDLSKSAQQASGLASFVYFLYSSRADRAERKRLGDLAGSPGGMATAFQGLTYVQNPLTQNQVAGNLIARRTSGLRPRTVVASENRLEQNLRAEAKTVAGFFDKIPAVFEAYKDLMMTVAYESVVESFAPMVADFKVRLAQYNSTLPTAPTGWIIKTAPPPQIGRMLSMHADRQDGYIVALLIIGYYFNRLYKHDPSVQRAWGPLVTKYYRTDPVRSPLAAIIPGKVSTFSTATAVSTASEAIVSVFKSTQKYKQLVATPGAVNWSQMEKSATTYGILVKNSLVNELAQEFVRSLNNQQSLDEMLKLTIACSLIVNQVLSASASSKPGATSDKEIAIDDRYVSMLADLDYVNLYTKVLIVTAARKTELTGSGLNAKLRYPKPGRLSTSASKAERTMMFMFASCVLAYVDIGKVVMGYQDWTMTKNNLHYLIDEINKAEKD